ncbi:VOC family protein [Oryzifoliimicrobium ureilyticus]|uniref:VOC family protein n=1 Tax=Oryzifoliimicrobium ureilyticus TaxID=3113724 RepID=UPI00307676E0
MAYPLDHLVLPVANLSQARDRLSCLGFTVAAGGQHPFGTANACVFLADGTYLEPLAVFDPSLYEEAMKALNSFIRRDESYRTRCGEDGFSAVVLATDNALEDHENFEMLGLSGGRPVEFSRPIVLPDGRHVQGAFRLAFAADLRSPEIFFFTCQRLVAFPSDRRSLETHLNGVIGMRTVVLCSQTPKSFAPVLSAATNISSTRRTAFGLSINLPNVELAVMTPDGVEGLFDYAPAVPKGALQAVAIVFRSSNLAVTESHLAANGITYTRKQERILVKPAPGQGAVFAFEETE